MFDYSNLLGSIKTNYKTQEAFANALNMSLSALNQRLNNRVDWSPSEIMRACVLLDIDNDDIPKYFFTLKV